MWKAVASAPRGRAGRPPFALSSTVWAETHIWCRSVPGGRLSQFRGHAGASDGTEGPSGRSHVTARWCARATDEYKANWGRQPFTLISKVVCCLSLGLDS